MSKTLKKKKMPEPPDFLEGEALEIWWEYAPRVYSAGLLDELSATIFGLFCDSYYYYLRCLRESEEAKKNNADKKTMNLYKKILREDWNSVLTMGREFFLVPEGSRILILPPEIKKSKRQ